LPEWSCLYYRGWIAGGEEEGETIPEKSSGESEVKKETPIGAAMSKEVKGQTPWILFKKSVLRR